MVSMEGSMCTERNVYSAIVRWSVLPPLCYLPLTPHCQTRLQRISSYMSLYKVKEITLFVNYAFCWIAESCGMCIFKLLSRMAVPLTHPTSMSVASYVAISLPMLSVIQLSIFCQADRCVKWWQFSTRSNFVLQETIDNA